MAKWSWRFFPTCGSFWTEPCGPHPAPARRDDAVGIESEGTARPGNDPEQVVGPEVGRIVEVEAKALEDAGVEPAGIDYVNLHGTGTLDNDAAEARALIDLFGDLAEQVAGLPSGAGRTTQGGEDGDTP